MRRVGEARSVLFENRIKVVALLAAALSGDSAAADDPAPSNIPRFVEAAAPAGLEHVYDGSDPAFVVGGGAAALDCDGDGRQDLLFAGGAGPAALYLNTSEPGGQVRLERQPVEAFGLPEAELTRVTGAYPLDVDADGRDDVFLMRFGRNRLLRGVGDCRFEDVSDAYGLPAREDWTAAFAAEWRGEDVLPTLAVGNYVNRDKPLAKTGNCDPSYLLSPDPAAPGRYGAPIELTPRGCPLSMLFVDWSGRGATDLRVSNDREYADAGRGEQLFRLSGAGGGLSAQALGREEGWEETRIWGMGLAAADLDGDARPEIAVTNMADNRLEVLISEEEPSFENRALALGTMSQRPYVGADVRPSTSWHVAFEDFNNDGLWDLWIVKGNVDAMPQFAAFDPDSLLIGNLSGGFREVGFEAGVALPGAGRGGVAVDLNQDGLLELATVNRNGPARLFQAVPTGGAGGWLSVRLIQPGANVRAVGAVVEVEIVGKVLRREVAVGGGHAGGSAAPLHFGLGKAAQARVRVRWPDGGWSDWRAATANRALVIERTEKTE